MTPEDFIVKLLADIDECRRRRQCKKIRDRIRDLRVAIKKVRQWNPPKRAKANSALSGTELFRSA